MRLWNPITGNTTATLTKRGRAVIALAWSPDGTRLAAVSSDNIVRLWDFTARQTRRLLRRLLQGIYTPRAHFMIIHKARAATWSPDGTRLATTSHDGIVRLWDSATGERAGAINSATPVFATTFSPNGTYLAALHSDAEVTVHKIDQMTVSAGSSLAPVHIFPGQMTTSLYTDLEA